MRTYKGDEIFFVKIGGKQGGDLKQGEGGGGGDVFS